MTGELIQLKNVCDILFNGGVVERVTARGATVWEKLSVIPARLTIDAAEGSSASCTVNSRGPWTATLAEGNTQTSDVENNATRVVS